MPRSRSVFPEDSFFLLERSSKNFFAPPSLIALLHRTIPMRMMRIPMPNGNRPGETNQTFITPPQLSFMGITVMVYKTIKIPKAIRMMLVMKSFFLRSVLSMI
jgi:hypothetical protein